jgi:hypothetical protein
LSITLPFTGFLLLNTFSFIGLVWTTRLLYVSLMEVVDVNKTSLLTSPTRLFHPTTFSPSSKTAPEKIESKIDVIFDKKLFRGSR